MCELPCHQEQRERLKLIRTRIKRFTYTGLAVISVFAVAPGVIPDSERVIVVSEAHAEDAQDHNWRVSEASFYGPGLYGNTMACGGTLTPSTQAVAHKSLPCGTLVRFEWHGKELVLPVRDRGPYTAGREWDLTAGACEYLGRCFTAPIAWTR